MLEQFLKPYRVLDLSDEKGAFCGKLLGDLGADVIKVEPPTGDSMRFRGPFAGNEVHPEKSLHFLYFNTSKGSITLNIETSGGRDIFRTLAGKADVVIESFPSGYLASLGLDYPKLRDENPRLVMCSITPFGQKGPLSRYKAADIVVMAMSGYMQLIGDPGGEPLVPGGEQSFYPASQYAAVGIAAALFWRDAISGEGQRIDVSMQEAMITYYQEQTPATMWCKTGQNLSPIGAMGGIAPPCGIYPCKDGWFSFSVVTPEEWDTLAHWMHEVTGNDEVLEEKYRGGFFARIPHRDMVNALIIEFADRLSARELFLEGQKRNLAVLPVNTVADLLEDQQLNERGFWVNLDHPVVRELRYPSLPYYSGTSGGAPRKAAPLLGEDNVRIYCGELGYSLEDLSVLRTAGTI